AASLPTPTGEQVDLAVPPVALPHLADDLVHVAKADRHDVLQLLHPGIDGDTHHRVDAPPGAEAAVGLAAEGGDQAGRHPHVALEAIHHLVGAVRRSRVQLSHVRHTVEHVGLPGAAIGPTAAVGDDPGRLAGTGQGPTVRE